MGNHFAKFGVVDITDPANDLHLPVGQYLGALSHSGSCGLDAAIAQRYTKVAMDMPAAVAGASPGLAPARLA